MEGLSTQQAKGKLLEIIRHFRELNKQQPVKHVHLYLKSSWMLEIIVYAYGIFLILDYILLSSEVERLIIGILVLLMLLRYIYYWRNRSKLQWEGFDDRMKDIEELLKNLKEGEDLTHRSYRSMDYNIINVYRDKTWVKLPGIVLLEGDIVSAIPGNTLPAEAEGLDYHYKGITVQPFEEIKEFVSTDILEARRRLAFVLKTSPSYVFLEQALTDRVVNKKRPATFYMLCLKLAYKIFSIYTIIVTAVNIIIGILWIIFSERQWDDILSNPSVFFLSFIPLLLPSLVKFLTCWGNSVLWYICESLDSQQKPRSRSAKQAESLSSLLKLPANKTSGNVFEMAALAAQAEEDFEYNQSVSSFPPLSFSACFAKCRSFLIGGIQREFNILDMLSSTTFMCFIDKEGIISENAKYIDEVVVMGPEEKLVPLDVIHKSPLDILSGETDYDQIAFIEAKWVEYLPSLKPLVLSAILSKSPRPYSKRESLLNLNDDHPDLNDTGELFFSQPRLEIAIFEECLCVLAKLIGFTETSIRNHRHVCTFWSTWRPTNTDSLHDVSYKISPKRRERAFISAVQDTTDKQLTQRQFADEIKNKLLLPCHLLTNIVEKEGSYQVLSQGNPRVILQNCTDYWDGNHIVLLDESDRQRINTLLLQWTADDYDTIAYSYKPLVDEEILNIINDPNELNSLDERTKDLLQSAQKKHIFLGMIALTNHPKPEANHFIEDTKDAGIRFVIFSDKNYLETKAFGDDLGLDTAWNSCISLSDAPIPEEILNKAGQQVLPRGIEEIKKVLEDHLDTVPLLVSMFSDSSKASMHEMIKIYQEYGEVVLVIGGCLHPQNLNIYQAADISIGIAAQPCGYCSTCNGLRLFYAHSPGILEKVAEKLITMPCTFRLNLKSPLYLILQVIKEARRFMSNIQNGLLFTVMMYVSWSFMTCIALALGLPAILSPLQCGYLALVVTPSLSLSFLAAPADPQIMKRLPIKSTLFNINDHWSFTANQMIRVILFTVMMLYLHIWHLGNTVPSDKIFGFQWVDDYDDSDFMAFKIINFFWGVFLLCIFSMGYVNGHESWFKLKKITNIWWLGICVLNITSAIVVCVIYLAVYEQFEEFKATVENSYADYISFFFACFGLVIILELLNWNIHRKAKKLQMTLDLYFQTKLGLHSPR
ncbi:unnamed protein product [Blepharisma stoltei]|uniref:Cation-transporting P-type ATPase C-terminal domain-containing protein n=1 Tax=Blepharisma stoltei TaxID=1481888 RepID=A0AAU9K1Q3_9CILI|nr:unnamed protein product [Blepharisma stoltei]